MLYGSRGKLTREIHMGAHYVAITREQADRLASQTNG